MLASSLRILPLTTIVRTRALPVEGRVLVRPGQKVTPADVIAEALVNQKHSILDVAAELGIPPAHADAALKVKRGQKISKGEVLGESSGIFGREALSPLDGLVVATGGGKVVLETGGAALQIRAGLAGTVSQIIENRGAVLRASGALIQGCWGNGKMDSGILAGLLKGADDTLEPSQLEVSLRGSIVLGGHVAELKTLQNAAEILVRGLILASLAPGLLSAAQQAPYPILLLEGFGKRPIGAQAFKLISTNLKREVSVNAENFNRFKGTRPEIFISLPVGQEPPEARDIETFSVGQLVRINWLSRPAQSGTLTQLFEQPLRLPGGVLAPGAQIRLETGEVISAPLSNLEALG
ncbi:MAG: hypothetical protein OHK0031_04020 [Anaerolineales bacterium]